jgi:PII-like signaling protein
MVNMPLIIEVIDEQLKLEPLLIELKRIVGGNGLVRSVHNIAGFTSTVQ